ncbi:hypothetical protein WCD74_07990 [Actinomycetospora sp. OC33-EN08]|uniref:DUF4129 domain-containing protein n=1 Tax=Actinomycetospora aurantiaca TaxID=3129233 RepID=A0ABU8MK54_9PSEU
MSAELLAFVLVALVVVALVVWRSAVADRPLRPLADDRLRPSRDTVRRIRERSAARRPGTPHVHRLRERLRLEHHLHDDEIDRRVAVVLTWWTTELAVLEDGERTVATLVAAAKEARAVGAATAPAPMTSSVLLDPPELATAVRGVVDDVLDERSAVPTGYAAGFADGHRAVGDLLRARCELVAERRREAEKGVVTRLEAIERFNARRAAAKDAGERAVESASSVAATLADVHPRPAASSPRTGSDGVPAELREHDLYAVSVSWITRELSSVDDTVSRWRDNLTRALARLPERIPEPRRDVRPLERTLVRDLDEVAVHPSVPGGSGDYLNAYDFAYRGVLDRLRKRIEALESRSTR